MTEPMPIPEGITGARKFMTSAMISLDRDADHDLVLGLASHFAEWKYGPGLEHGQGGEVLSLTGGDGRQLRVGTYGEPSQIENMYSPIKAMPQTEDYLFMGEGRTVVIHRHERVGGDGTLDRYITELGF